MKLTIGIRPEHLALGPGGLSLRVDLVEPLGSETLIHGRLAAPDETPLVLRVPGRGPDGDLIPVVVPPEAMHVFDGATGLRMS